MVGEIVFFIKAKKNTSEQQDLVLFFSETLLLLKHLLSHSLCNLLMVITPKLAHFICLHLGHCNIL